MGHLGRALGAHGEGERESERKREKEREIKPGREGE